MDFISENLIGLLGMLVNAAGLIVGAAGLCYAYLAHRAAKSAEAAAIEARQALTRTLRLVDVQEAIDLVDRLKDWLGWGEVAIVRELYSNLQSKLSGVAAALPNTQEKYKEIISNALLEIEALQERAYSAMLVGELDTETLAAFMSAFNSIQRNLRTMLNDMKFSDDSTES